MIRFLGKRTAPNNMDHKPNVHPASASSSLPDSFAAYRQKAQQHGPLTKSRNYGGLVGSHSGVSLGPVKPAENQYFDRAELPQRFRRTRLLQTEIDAIESGGASLWN